MKVQLCVLLAVLSYAAADFKKAALDAHNNLRHKHHDGPLTLDNKLNKSAQKWADHLASINRMEHSPPGGGFGENLYFCQPSHGSKDEDAKAAVQAWYDEIKDYNFRRPGFAGNTGHFTQVVWNGSHKLGVGYAVNKRSKSVFVVAQYTPAGNFMGQFPENVKPA